MDLTHSFVSSHISNTIIYHPNKWLPHYDCYGCCGGSKDSPGCGSKCYICGKFLSTY